MLFGPVHDYKIGDDAWIYVGNHEGQMSRGKVIAALDLPGYTMRHYVVEIETAIEPLLEVRDSTSMRPLDPRLTQMSALLKKRFDLDTNVAQKAAADLLAIADGGADT